jgi:DNA end-binding protein Ku
LARMVLANREHVIALEPLGKGILGTTLRDDYEVRDEQQFFAGVPNLRIPKEMLELAEHILDAKAGHSDPNKFRDETFEAASVPRNSGSHDAACRWVI